MRIWFLKNCFCTTGLFLILMLGSFTHEQAGDSISVPGQILVPKGDFQSLTIPLRRVGNLFIIEARIGDQTGNFIFDTGSAKLVLNRTYFRKDLHRNGDTSGGITGTVGQVFQTHVERLDFSELYFEDVVADVINLGHIENRRGIKILGLLGMNLFGSLEMVIDIRRSELHLYRIDKEGARIIRGTEHMQADFTCPIKEVDGVVFLEAAIGGKKLSFCLDTGAEANVMSSSAPKIALKTISITRRSGLTGAGSGGVEVLYGTMNEFFAGDHSLHPMQTIITDINSLAQAYGVSLSGVLGYDFFEKGIVCINLLKKELGMRLVEEAEL